MKGKPRFRIDLDSGDSLFLSSDVILEFMITKGKVLSSDELQLIETKQSDIDMKQYAYNLISYKPRTTKQVVRKLKEKGYSDESIGNAISFLTDFGLLDDEKFAIGYIGTLISKKHFGKSRIRIELIKKGIEKEMATSLVNKYFIEDSHDLAYKAAEKKMKLIRNKEPDKQKSSLAAYLARQGYDWDIIKDVIKNLLPNK